MRKNDVSGWFYYTIDYALAYAYADVVFMYDGRDCPKTQKSILKVKDSIQYVVNKKKVDSKNAFIISLDIKVENDGRSEKVFG